MQSASMQRSNPFQTALIFLGLLFCFHSPVHAQRTPRIAGCGVFPADNVWNAPVDTLPVDPNSDLYVQTIGASAFVHPDFGSGTWAGAPIGIPFVAVAGTQPMVGVTFVYADESDPGPYPIPPDAPIEGGPDSTGDRHVLVLEQDNCILYEMFAAYPQPGDTWDAGSGAVFDLKSNALRPDGWTSSDAAGLPVLAGLVRYDEVATGEITHAIRFTAPQTRNTYVWPARHFASSLTGIQYPPMGQRFRLKAGFDISGFAPEVQVILTAFKKYGIILADNGSPWYISGVPDESWDNDVLRQLRQVFGSDFEAVDTSGLMADPDSGRVNNVWLLRNDETTLLAPLTPARGAVFTGSGDTSLDLTGLNGTPEEGEGILTGMPGSDDDDDAYAFGFASGDSDPDTTVACDPLRPLVLYEVSIPTDTLRIVKEDPCTLRVFF